MAAAQFNQHGSWAIVKVDTIVFGKFQAACISKITVELTAFLPCTIMSEMKYNGECCGCFTTNEIKCGRSIAATGQSEYRLNVKGLVWRSPTLTLLSG